MKCTKNIDLDDVFDTVNSDDMETVHGGVSMCTQYLIACANGTASLLHPGGVTGGDTVGDVCSLAKKYCK